MQDREFYFTMHVQLSFVLWEREPGHTLPQYHLFYLLNRLVLQCMGNVR